MNVPSVDELLEKIGSFGDLWDFQHDEIFFKHDMHEAATVYKQNDYEKQFQALLLNIFVTAGKIKRSRENA